MPIARAEFEILVEAATEQVEEDYRAAIASEIEGNRDGDSWLRVRHSTARAYVLAKLLGLASAYEAARRLGADFQPETFARLSLGPDDDFVTGLFAEAIEEFEDRVPILATIAKELIAEGMTVAWAITIAESTSAVADLAAKSVAIRLALRDAFWVSDVDQATTINLRELMAGIIRGDREVEAVRGVSGFIDEAQLQGAANLTRSRLGTVYRNNLSSAFNDGNAVGLAGDEVKTIFPLVFLREIQDSRVRESHRPMNGYVNSIEVFASGGLVPPNGHRCRASIRGVTWTEARRKSLLSKDETGEEFVDPVQVRSYNGSRQAMIDEGVYPDEGFAVRTTLVEVASRFA